MSYIQPASATQEEKTSAGVLKFKHFLGLTNLIVLGK